MAEGMTVILPYRRERAVQYAKQWALARNPLFPDFSELGGDCTNFVSQCILAGCCQMNLTPTYGWYCFSEKRRAPAWSGVGSFYRFLTGDPEFREPNRGIGPFGSEVSRLLVSPGDVVQYADENGKWYHSVIVTGLREGEILVSAHSLDSLDRPLSDYSFSDLRYLHIEGVSVSTEGEVCYSFLLGGGEEPTE